MKDHYEKDLRIFTIRRVGEQPLSKKLLAEKYEIYLKSSVKNHYEKEFVNNHHKKGLFLYFATVNPYTRVLTKLNKENL